MPMANTRYITQFLYTYILYGTLLSEDFGGVVVVTELREIDYIFQCSYKTEWNKQGNKLHMKEQWT